MASIAGFVHDLLIAHLKCQFLGHVRVCFLEIVGEVGEADLVPDFGILVLHEQRHV